MPKLKNRPPKLCKNGDYTFIRYQGKKISLGRWGSDESKQAYARFITELQTIRSRILPSSGPVRNSPPPAMLDAERQAEEKNP